MWVERVVLEDHRNIAILGGDVRHIFAADHDAALIDFLETGQHAQCRGLPAAGGSYQHQELAVP